RLRPYRHDVGTGGNRGQAHRRRRHCVERAAGPEREHLCPLRHPQGEARSGLGTTAQPRRHGRQRGGGGLRGMIVMSKPEGPMPLALEIEAMPFVVRLLDGPDNPAGIPNTYPFRLALDAARGHLYQPDDPALAAMLDAAYRTGSLLGTAMDDTASGDAYANDFLRFIRANAPRSDKCLEIGAGRGFLTRRLIDAGLVVDALEPGVANAPHWRRHGVNVIADSFPSAKLSGEYGLI